MCEITQEEPHRGEGWHQPTLVLSFVPTVATREGASCILTLARPFRRALGGSG